MSKFVGLLVLLLITVVFAEYDHSLGCAPKHKDHSPAYPPEHNNNSPIYPPEHNDDSPAYPPEDNDDSPAYPPKDNDDSPAYPPEQNDSSPAYPPKQDDGSLAYPPEQGDDSPAYPPEDNDASPAYPPEHDDDSPAYPPEHKKHGLCGKLSTLRILTHMLRHCKKAARDVEAPVSSQCCKGLAKVSIPCLHAIFASDAFKKVGVDPKIAMTIPHRCHFAYPLEISLIP